MPDRTSGSCLAVLSMSVQLRKNTEEARETY